MLCYIKGTGVAVCLCGDHNQKVNSELRVSVTAKTPDTFKKKKSGKLISVTEYATFYN